MTCVRMLECYFLGTSGDETETHLLPNNNNNNMNSSSNNTAYMLMYGIVRLFRNAEKDVETVWALRDIMHLRSGHYTSLTQHKTHR